MMLSINCHSKICPNHWEDLGCLLEVEQNDLNGYKNYIEELCITDEGQTFSTST